MKRRRGRLITALLAVIVLLLGAFGFSAARQGVISADETESSLYYERILQCIEDNENPLSDADVENTLRIRLGEFNLTEPEADAVVETLNSEKLDSLYRDLYLLSIFNYECNTKENHATSYYSAQDNTVHIGKNVAPNNFVATFFHESAHAVQISLWDGSETAEDKSETFRFPVERQAYDALVSDVEDMIFSTMERLQDSDYSTTQKQAVAKAFINGYDRLILSTEDTTVTENLLETCENVSSIIHSDMMQIPNSNASMVSDVYGGITNNKILGGMGHPAVKVNPDGTSFYYWYDEDGNSTYNQLTEGWAEFFSANVTSDDLNMEYNRQFFPSAVEKFEEMAESMLDYYLNIYSSSFREAKGS